MTSLSLHNRIAKMESEYLFSTCRIEDLRSKFEMGAEYQERKNADGIDVFRGESW